MLGIPLHLILVHFPIALVLIGFVCDARGYFSKTPDLHRMGYSLTLWSALGAGLAGGTGLQLAHGRLESSSAIAHAGAGLAGTIVLIAFAVVRYSAEARRGEQPVGFPTLWLVVEAIGVTAIVLAAITGHRLVLGLL